MKTTITNKPNQYIRLDNVNCIPKRLIDYFFGIILFILFIPLMAIVALIIYIVDPGPVFFIQDREGLGGKKIRVVKFRTMYTDSPKRLENFFRKYPEREKEWKQFFKLDKDPRIIRWVGIFLRKSSLDELPNIFNLLKGEISLVGPRPFPYYHLENFDEEFRKLRTAVWPGITGLWQIKRGDTDAQIKLDTEYVKNWSFLLDLKILIKTIPVVLLVRKPHF